MSLRRSTRQTRTNATASGSKLPKVDLAVSDVPSEDGAVDESEIEEQEDEDDEVVKVKARGKGKGKRQAPKAKAVGQPPAKKVRRTRGSLNSLLNMNLDIVGEIFGHLEPLDLLHLAWAGQATRNYLMSKVQSEATWKAARRNIPGLPDCPSDMSEPQYANLAFGKACHDCLRNLSHMYTSWAARTRLCSKCMVQKFRKVSDGRFPFWEAPKLKSLRTLLPKVRKGYEIHYYRELDLKWQAEYEALEDIEEIQNEWLQAHIEKQEAMNKHADACILWYDNHTAQRNQAKESSFQERLETIFDRLETTGWEVEVDDLRRSYERSRTFAAQPTIVKACNKNLTERIIQNLLPTLEKYLKSYRDEKVIRDRRELLEARLPLLNEVVKTYRLTVPPDTAAVDVGDFFGYKEISNFVINTPEISNLSHFDPIRSRLPEIAVELQTEMKGKLCALITAKLGAEYSFDRNTVLALATTVFLCSRCSDSRFVWYPRVLAHGCVCQWRWPEENRENYADYKVLINVTKRTLWNRFGVLEFDEESQKILADVVMMCGLDPKAATVDEMDALDPILECIPCNTAEAGRLTMRWNLVPEHFLDEHVAPARTYYARTRAAMKLEVLKDGDADTIRRRLNEEEELKRANQLYKDMACTHCSLDGNAPSLRRHVIKEHGIAKPSNGDIVVKIDSRSVRRVFRAWPPRAPEVAVKAAI